jgi:hypothetical protein
VSPLAECPTAVRTVSDPGGALDDRGLDDIRRAADVVHELGAECLEQLGLVRPASEVAESMAAVGRSARVFTLVLALFYGAYSTYTDRTISARKLNVQS